MSRGRSAATAAFSLGSLQGAKPRLHVMRRLAVVRESRPDWRPALTFRRRFSEQRLDLGVVAEAGEARIESEPLTNRGATAGYGTGVAHQPDFD